MNLNDNSKTLVHIKNKTRYKREKKKREREREREEKRRKENLGQKFVFKLVEFLHDLFVDLTITDCIDYLDAAIEYGTDRFVITHSQRRMTAVVFDGHLIAFPEDSVAPGWSTVLLARVPVICARIVLIGRSELNCSFLSPENRYNSHILDILHPLDILHQKH